MTHDQPPAGLTEALQAALPPEHHAAVDDIAALLGALSREGAPLPPAVQQRLRADVRLGAALVELAGSGRPLRLAGALIEFSHTNVHGNIHIRNVAGRDVFDVTVHLPLPPPSLDEALARLAALPLDGGPPRAPLPAGSRMRRSRASTCQSRQPTTCCTSGRPSP